MRIFHQTVLSLLILAPSLSLIAADNPNIEDARSGIPRFGPQLLVGTSGVEPGIFAEWRHLSPGLVLRPELFINKDDRIGGGGAIGWDHLITLPERHTLFIGPRVVHHNSDDSGWEADALAIWSFDLVPAHRGQHFLEVLGALGVREDDEPKANKHKVGASVGVGYGVQF